MPAHRLAAAAEAEHDLGNIYRLFTMQRRKNRHQIAAHVRWRAAAARAEHERTECGIPDRPTWTDSRQPFALDFAHLGWRDVRLEPRQGYIAWRCVDADSGEVIACKALGEMLRWIAGQVPRQMGSRHFQ